MNPVTLLTLLTALATGCATTGPAVTPTQSQLAQTIQTQYAAGVDALNAYCDVASADVDIARICVPALSTINATESTVHAAIGALVAMLAKKAIAEAHTRAAQCAVGVPLPAAEVPHVNQ